MDLKTTLQSDLKDAMRRGENMRKSTLRMALSAFKLAEVKKGSRMDEGAFMAILFQEIMSRKETISDAEKANRPEMISQAEQEIKILQTYLPPALTPQELEAFAKAAIDETGATSMREMGQVMKILLPKTRGRATDTQASQVVRKMLQ